MALKDYSPSAASNTSVGSIYVGANMARGDVDGAIRQIMADLAPLGGLAYNVVHIDSQKYGADSTGTNASTAAFQAAITDLRSTGTTLSTDGLGSGPLTAYACGVLVLGKGVYKVAADTLELTQDLGLTIIGQGSRRTNNAVRGKTTILITGTSSGYGIRAKGNGARGLTLMDLDLCYETSGFTGDLLDIYSAPGVSATRVFFGTYGITAPTRLQTARSCIRLTYDEFLSLTDCVFDGAVRGIYSDDTREPSASFSDFGGSVTTLRSCVFYDFTGDMIEHGGTRTRSNLLLENCAWNPISVDCQRALDLNNVVGLQIDSSVFQPSVSNKPTSEWVRLINVNGVISGTSFGDLAKAGTISGGLLIQGCAIDATDGFTMMGGPIQGQSNKFSRVSIGYEVSASPTSQLSLRLGPDTFTNTVTTAYSLGAATSSVKGRIDYDANNDASANRFTGSNPRILVLNGDEETATQSADFTTSKADTGRTYELTKAGSAQAVTLHAPTGVIERLRFFKTTSQQVTITCAGGDNLYTGETAVKTIATGGATAVGAFLELESYGSSGWKVTRASAGWTFS